MVKKKTYSKYTIRREGIGESIMVNIVECKVKRGQGFETLTLTEELSNGETRVHVLDRVTLWSGHMQNSFIQKG